MEDTTTTVQYSPLVSNHYRDIEFTLEDIFINLTLISKIEVGNKLTQNEKYINIDNNWMLSSITRWMFGHNRTTSIQFLTAIFVKAFEYNETLKDKTTESMQQLLRLNTDLKNAINGLVNLKQTYYYDKLTQSELDVMIDNIRSKLDLNFKYMNQGSKTQQEQQPQPQPQDTKINSPKINTKREDNAAILHIEKKRHHHTYTNNNQNIHTQPNEL
jgi:hypothetical protein